MKSPIICMAGSMKQKSMIEKISRKLTWEGCVVLMPIDMKLSEEEIKKHGLERMMEFFRALQYQRILLADIVIAVPKKDGTFGTDTQKETEFANEYGRMVLKMTSPDEIDTEEIKIALSKSKKNTIMDLSTLLLEALRVMESLPGETEGWAGPVREIVKEVDKQLFADYNIARDTVTNILKDAKQ